MSHIGAGAPGNFTAGGGSGGDATAANQLLIIDAVDGIEAKQDTQITSLAAIKTAVETIDNAIAGSEMQVDVVAALPAGNNNIGDVDIASSVLPTGASTLAEQQTQTASLSVLDDWDESDRAKVNLVAGQAGITAGAGAVAANTPRLTLASDDPAVASLSVLDDWDETDRAKVNPIAGQAGVQGGSGTVTALTQRVVLATDVALPAGTNAIGKLAANSGVDIGDVDVTSSALPTGASTLAEQQTQTASLSVMDDWDNGASDGASVSGDVAHDGVDAGEPVKLGHKAIAHGANPTAVAAADRTNWYANRAGIPFVIGGHMNVVTFEAAYTGAQTDAAIVTISTGLKIVVTSVQATCDNANTVDVGLRVGFGTANTPTTTGVVLTHPGIAAGGGVARGDGSGIVGIGADNEDLRITSEVPTGGSLRILVSYYTVES